MGGGLTGVDGAGTADAARARPDRDPSQTARGARRRRPQAARVTALSSCLEPGHDRPARRPAATACLRLQPAEAGPQRRHRRVDDLGAADLRVALPPARGGDQCVAVDREHARGRGRVSGSSPARRASAASRSASTRLDSARTRRYSSAASVVERRTAREQQPPAERLLLDEAEERVEGGPPALLGRARRAERGAQVPQQRLLLESEHLDEQRVLGREVVVEHRAGDAGGAWRSARPTRPRSHAAANSASAGLNDQLAALRAGSLRFGSMGGHRSFTGVA